MTLRISTERLSDPRMIRRRSVALSVVAAVSVSITACGDGDSGTTPLADWVTQFDRACVETAEQLSAPGLSEEEWDRISDAALAEMRAVPEPDEMAETAMDLIDAIEASSDGIERTDAEINALDEQVLTAVRALGVSDACIGGASGE